jgi:hypothetical protein
MPRLQVRGSNVPENDCRRRNAPHHIRRPLATPKRSLSLRHGLYGCRHDRQNNVRGVHGIMINGLPCHNHLCIGADRLSGVEISIVMREVAARYFEPDLMPRLKQIAGRKHRDRIFVDSSRIDRFVRFQAVAVARPNDAVVEIDDLAARFDIDELRGPVGVGRRCRGEQLDRNRSCNLDRLPERWRRVREHVGAPFNIGLIVGPDRRNFSEAAGMPALTRYRVGGIV